MGKRLKTYTTKRSIALMSNLAKSFRRHHFNGIFQVFAMSSECHQFSKLKIAPGIVEIKPINLLTACKPKAINLPEKKVYFLIVACKKCLNQCQSQHFLHQFFFILFGKNSKNAMAV